ncbi:MAG: thioredoxin [Buchnera aphidicola (Nurudea yanoniella)]
MKENVINVNEDNFDKKVLTSNTSVLVDFWADWCNPCKVLIPILDEISIEYNNRLIIAKVNIDSNSNIALKYSIKSIPTLLLFIQGRLVFTKVGVLSKHQLKEILNNHLE